MGVPARLPARTHGGLSPSGRLRPAACDERRGAKAARGGHRNRAVLRLADLEYGGFTIRQRVDGVSFFEEVYA
jgi:hypothetical protein